ncbi:hypothetical protein KGF86_06935 [Ornithinibacillus massiliensis]|uniref:Uncharacterized protein n=1 Tax=Ornithinibacillus massiliensis TaxID=1944633 RepID=A0ABS5MCV6_9BACI|nr:hypothetical protein [Ornithinibacillus massiliensis]MBS3679942.1 hypothetical protein [Ornithinibacillus massiliensis]
MENQKERTLAESINKLVDVERENYDRSVISLYKLEQINKKIETMSQLVKETSEIARQVGVKK